MTPAEAFARLLSHCGLAGLALYVARDLNAPAASRWGAYLGEYPKGSHAYGPAPEAAVLALAAAVCVSKET